MKYTKAAKYGFLLLIMSLNLSLKGQNELFSSELEVKIHQALYSFHFDEAKLLQNNIDIKQPTIAIILKTQELWWEAISMDDSFSAVNNAIDNYHKQCIETTEDIENLYFAALELRISASSKHYYAAFKNWRHITNELKNYPLEQKDTVSLFIHGIANCTKGELQRKIPFLVRDSFTFQENMTKGVEMLERCCKSPNSIINSESHYYLMRYYSDILHEYDQSLQHSSYLINIYPDNYIFRYYHILNLMETGAYEIARDAITAGIQYSNNQGSYSKIQRNYYSHLMRIVFETNEDYFN